MSKLGETAAINSSNPELILTTLYLCCNAFPQEDIHLSQHYLGQEQTHACTKTETALSEGLRKMDTNDLLFFFLMTSFCDHIKGKCMICKGLLCLYSSQVSCLFGGLPRKVTVMSLPYDKLTFYFHLRTSSFSNFHLSRGLRLRLACNSLILSFHVVNSSNIGFIFISSHGNCHLLAV